MGALEDKLMKACGYGSELEAHSLLAKGADPDAADSAGRGPLFWTVIGVGLSGSPGISDRAAIVADLLANGASPNRIDDRGETPLMVCARLGSGTLARILAAGGADATAVNPEGQTALDLAKKTLSREARPNAELLLAVEILTDPSLAHARSLEAQPASSTAKTPKRRRSDKKTSTPAG